MENERDRIRVRLIIEGRVQGVYFRASTVQEAQRLGLTGWVMNRLDGSVEVVAEGSRAKIDELVTWCHHGPAGAIVRHVSQHYAPFKNEFERFGIRR
jgi:acylphosphatase